MSLLGPVPEYMKKANRVRSVIVLCLAIVVALGAAFVGFYAQYAKAQRMMLDTQLVLPGVDVQAEGESSKDDSPSQQVFAPNLVSLLGQDSQKAIEGLGHGATVVSTQASLDDKGKAVQTYQVALTSEPADKLAGPPTVFVVSNSRDVVIEAGYQAGMRYLGYGSLSLVDAVENVHVVEKVLTEAGLPLSDQQLLLPEDSASYTQYGSDGTTIVSQECSFAGDSKAAGSRYAWRAVVSYDYADANAKSNLAYTMRRIAIYVSEK